MYMESLFFTKYIRTQISLAMNNLKNNILRTFSWAQCRCMTQHVKYGLSKKPNKFFTWKLEAGKKNKAHSSEIEEQIKNNDTILFCFTMWKDSMNNLISIVTGFYCETKTISFLVVTDINHHSVFPHKHLYLISLSWRTLLLKDNRMDSHQAS